jgi:multidrug efflux pump subunit AcrA (membrane-fusion protein)
MKINRILTFFLLFVPILAFGWKTQTVTSYPVDKIITIGGTVIPYKKVTILAQMPGRIEYISNREGENVKDRTVLVVIDDDDLLAKRDQAIANLKSAQANYSQAIELYNHELYYPRTDDTGSLSGMGMPSLFDKFFTRRFSRGMGYGDYRADRFMDLYTQDTNRSKAYAAIQKARFAVNELNAKLKDTRSFAPFDGVITKKLIEKGDTVQPGMPMLEVAQTKFLRIEAQIPARLVPNLKRGSFVDAKLDVGNTYVKARVSQIYPIADEIRHTVRVKFDLPKGVPGGPGMYAEIFLVDKKVEKTKSLPVVDIRALVYRGSLPYVFVEGADKEVQLRIVRTGRRIGADKIAILAGLKEGERLIVDPAIKTNIGTLNKQTTKNVKKQ